MHVRSAHTSVATTSCTGYKRVCCIAQGASKTLETHSDFARGCFFIHLPSNVVDRVIMPSSSPRVSPCKGNPDVEMKDEPAPSTCVVYQSEQGFWSLKDSALPLPKATGQRCLDFSVKRGGDANAKSIVIPLSVQDFHKWSHMIGASPDNIREMSMNSLVRATKVCEQADPASIFQDIFLGWKVIRQSGNGFRIKPPLAGSRLLSRPLQLTISEAPAGSGRRIDGIDAMARNMARTIVFYGLRFGKTYAGLRGCAEPLISPHRERSCTCCR